MINYPLHFFKKRLPYRRIAFLLNSYSALPFKALKMSSFLKSWCAMRGGLWQNSFFLNMNEILDPHFHIDHIILSIEYIRIRSTWSNEDLAQLIASPTYRRHCSHPSFLALIASLFHEIDNTEETLRHATAALNIDPTALDGYFNLTCFAFAHRLSISGFSREHSQQIAVLSKILIDFQNIFDGIRTHSTIANVGNARCELGRSNGTLIDDHDIVVRFNNFPTDPLYAKDYGSKCSIWVRTPSLAEVPDRKDIQPQAIVFTGTLLRHMRTGNWKWMISLCDRDVKLALFDDSTFRKLTNMLNAPPSAGILTVQSLNHLPAQLFKINNYGFEFNHGKQNHYFDSTKASDRHNWEEERRLYSELNPVPAKL